MTEPTAPAEPIFTLSIDEDGLSDARLLGGHPRLVAHMLRHIADSMDKVGDELGLPALPECNGHASAEVFEGTSPDELEANRAEFDRKRQAAKLS